MHVHVYVFSQSKKKKPARSEDEYDHEIQEPLQPANVHDEGDSIVLQVIINTQQSQQICFRKFEQLQDQRQ